MKKALLALVVLTVVVSTPVFATTLTDVKVNGIALDSVGGFTDPSFNIWPFGTAFSVEFTIDGPDTVNVVFTGGGGSISNPVGFGPLVNGGVTSTVTFTRSFTQWGTWDGTIDFTLVGTYSPLDGSPATSAPSFPVTFVHTPEPATFALFGLGGLGLAIASVRRRRKTAKV